MKTVDYLGAIKKRHNIKSDYAVAKLLKVSRQTISGYRNTGSTFDHVVAARAAALLDLDPVKVLADIEVERAERAKLPEQREVWERVVKKLATGAGALLVALGLGAPRPVEAGQFDSTRFTAQASSVRQPADLHIMRQAAAIGRRLARIARRLAAALSRATPGAALGAL